MHAAAHRLRLLHVRVSRAEPWAIPLQGHTVTRDGRTVDENDENSQTGHGMYAKEHPKRSHMGGNEHHDGNHNNVGGV